MAVFHHQLDNTFHEPFINVLVAKINNLKTKIMINKIKDTNDINEDLPGSEDNIIENNQIELETRRT